MNFKHFCRAATISTLAFLALSACDVSEGRSPVRGLTAAQLFDDTCLRHFGDNEAVKQRLASRSSFNSNDVTNAVVGAMRIRHNTQAMDVLGTSGATTLCSVGFNTNDTVASGAEAALYLAARANNFNLDLERFNTKLSIPYRGTAINIERTPLYDIVISVRSN